MAIIGAMLIWSVSGMVVKIALVSFSGLSMLVLRFTLAALIMLLLGLIVRKSAMLSLQLPSLKDLPLFLIAGFFQPCIYYLLETYTYKALSSPTIAEAIMSTSPVLSPIFAVVFLREKVTPKVLVGILISTIGMLMLVLVGSQSFAIGNSWGVLTALASVVTAIMYSVMLKKIPEKYTPLTIVFYTQVCALLMFYPMWIIQEGGRLAIPLNMSLWTSQLWWSIGSVGYLAVMASVTGFILFCYTVRQIGITQANAFNNVRPIFTALAMLIIYNEHLPFGKILGIVLVVVGLFICQKKERQKTI